MYIDSNSGHTRAPNMYYTTGIATEQSYTLKNAATRASDHTKTDTVSLIPSEGVRD